MPSFLAASGSCCPLFLSAQYGSTSSQQITGHDTDGSAGCIKHSGHPPFQPSVTPALEDMQKVLVSACRTGEWTLWLLMQHRRRPQPLRLRHQFLACWLRQALMLLLDRHVLQWSLSLHSCRLESSF